MTGEVHYTDPFADPAEARSPVRRLRGRLAAPVTLWTSGPPEARAGLTVSSLLIADGSPPQLLGLIADTSDLHDALVDTGRFVVHVLEDRHRRLAERFAGLFPSPGGPFADLDVVDTPHGPRIEGLTTRAACSVAAIDQAGYYRLVRGTIDDVTIGELHHPLVHFRGRFRRFADA